MHVLMNVKFKATHKHPQYVTLIAFWVQQWLHESSSMLRDIIISCLVTNIETIQIEAFNLIEICVTITEFYAVKKVTFA
jgi:hypothetical protein